MKTGQQRWMTSGLEKVDQHQHQCVAGQSSIVCVVDLIGIGPRFHHDGQWLDTPINCVGKKSKSLCETIEKTKQTFFSNPFQRTSCVTFDQLSVSYADNVVDVEIGIDLGAAITKLEDGHLGSNQDCILNEIILFQDGLDIFQHIDGKFVLIDRFRSWRQHNAHVNVGRIAAQSVQRRANDEQIMT